MIQITLNNQDFLYYRLVLLIVNSIGMRIKFLCLAIAFFIISPLKVEAKKIVCIPPKFSNRLSNLSNYAYGELNKKEWQTLVKRNLKTKTNTLNNAKRGLTLYETQLILRFSGEKIKSACDGEAEYWVWIDKNNKKAVHIIFFGEKKNNYTINELRINILKGIGF
ncbi:hypothetical protein [Myxosarcina sp. GI1]|uniref:hypothetical protein n=1 Tax=Myxosarcina sp. GI1 TaxID=1541065 RepID=UPI000569A002|nr:hypothetical protein [Myxosarcina sp. GI1]